VGVSVSGCYFTGGRDRSTGYGTPVAGDGIKISGGGANRDIVITGNVFYDCYRDCIDVFSGGRRILISDNIMYRFGAVALDIKTRAQLTHDSPDGEPICGDVSVTGNYIYDDQDRSGYIASEGAVG